MKTTLATLLTLTTLVLSSQLRADDVKEGEKLFNSKGCTACHTTDGEDDIGPSVKGLYGKKREFKEGPALAKADEAYIKESIYKPAAKVVKGFKPKMASYEGQINEAELKQITEYIKSLK